jgi:cytochrome P450
MFRVTNNHLVFNIVFGADLASGEQRRAIRTDVRSVWCVLHPHAQRNNRTKRRLAIQRRATGALHETGGIRRHDLNTDSIRHSHYRRFLAANLSGSFPSSRSAIMSQLSVVREVDSLLGPVEVDLGDPNANIVSHDTYVTGFPHAAFRALRDNDPVSWTPEQDGSGFWSITRYQDVLHVSRNPELFSSAAGIRLEEMDAQENAARRTMMEMDAPEHTNYRRLVSKPFARPQVINYEPAIRNIAADVVERVRTGGQREFDFVDAIAKQLPMRMLGRLLGVPDSDGPMLVDFGDALLGNTDPDFTSHPVDLVDTEAFRLMPFRSPAGVQLFAYAQQQAEARRGCPVTDVIGKLLEPMADGNRLSEHEFNNFFTLLVAAGNDTTRYTLASGVQALLERPDVIERLQSDPSLIPMAVEEILRWGSVTMHFRRTANVDTQIGDTMIRRGDKVVIWFVSANFDERKFAQPFHFDVSRTPNEHAAFGWMSPHLCLGAPLARLEIRVLLEELLPRIRSIRQTGPVSRLRSNFILGIKTLPVQVEWA